MNVIDDQEISVASQLLVSQASSLRKIKDWPNNLEAQEAVFESYALFEVHVAPYGTNGKRLERAVEHLATMWGYTVNPRTMTKWVNDAMEAHGREMARRDAETGTEYDQSKIEDRIEEKLNEMVQEHRDFIADQSTNSDKRKREDELVQAGLRHRENVARSMIGGQVLQIGGSVVSLSSNGTISNDDVDQEPTPSIYKRHRRNPRHQQAIEELLRDEKADKKAIESERLIFEKEKFAQELELRKIELDAHRQKSDRQFEMDRVKLDLLNAENARRHEEFKMQMEFKMKKLEMMLQQNRK